MPDDDTHLSGPAVGESTAGADEPPAPMATGLGERATGAADEPTGQVWATTQQLDGGTGFGQPGHRVFGADDPVDDEDQVDDEDGDDAGDIAVIRSRPPVRKATLLLGVLVIAGAGFLGGVLVQKHDGKSSRSGASSLASAFASRLGSGAGAGGAGGASSFFSRAGGFTGLGGASGGATIGQVVTTSGSTVYVETTSGSVVAVDTSSAAITQTVSGTVGDIQPGSTVTVEGTKESNGTVDATSIAITPATTTTTGGS